MELIIKYATDKIREEFDNAKTLVDAILAIDKAIEMGLKQAAKDMADDYLISCEPEEEIVFKNHYSKRDLKWVYKRDALFIHDTNSVLVDRVPVVNEDLVIE